MVTLCCCNYLKDKSYEFYVACDVVNNACDFNIENYAACDAVNNACDFNNENYAACDAVNNACDLILNIIRHVMWSIMDVI